MKNSEFIAMLRKEATELRFSGTAFAKSENGGAILGSVYCQHIANRFDEAAKRLEDKALDSVGRISGGDDLRDLYASDSEKVATLPSSSGRAGDKPASNAQKKLLQDYLDGVGLPEDWLIDSGHPPIEVMSSDQINLGIDALYAYCLENKISGYFMPTTAERRGWPLPSWFKKEGAA